MPESCHGDLLRDSCIGVADRARTRERLTLPAVLARLSDPSTSTVAFTAVQAHQAHAWHAFLVQLAAMVCHRAGMVIGDADCRRAEWWAEHLLALADGCAEAWCLVVEDLRKPAFMQVPVSGDAKDYKKLIATPRELDVVDTARNHDAKSARGSADHWLFALVTLQTQQGYLGAKNYGIFRMNSGYGNRFAVGYADPSDLGTWFRRDVAALMTMRSITVDGGGFSAHNGRPLLWALAWDGSRDSCLSHTLLDPWCIEICRRIRLDQKLKKMIAKQATSEADRTIIQKDKLGKWVTQNGFSDPWMALRNAKAMAPNEQGFTTIKTVEYLLDPATTTPPTQQLQEKDIGSDLHWYGRTLVRGDRGTNGWHERLIPIPANVRRHWRDQPQARSIAAERARHQLEDSSSLSRDVLRSALRGLFEKTYDWGKKRMSVSVKKSVEKWDGLAQQQIDAIFFDHLWKYLDDERDAARRSWRRVIIKVAETTLTAAQASVPDDVRRWRALAASQRRFGEGLKFNPSKDNCFAASLRDAVPGDPAAPPLAPIH